ncbi:putative Alpha-(1,3)-fucosyltransferase C [Hypsibius exemplaris]|uniref:Fucosyltransferase n=1 Tax=Hypsibius exemplaris TaxID=2072580 RepID=A0A1W0WUB7_HYPEX|nr:putative Alpha-(1,3)-fucosyltransferase C [Hypsibius exemplaris]
MTRHLAPLDIKNVVEILKYPVWGTRLSAICRSPTSTPLTGVESVNNAKFKHESLLSGKITRRPGEPKLILLWDTFADLHLEDGSGMFHRFRCQQTRCSITRDRSLLTESQVVMFHMRETITPEKLPRRPPPEVSQSWVFAMKEPPVYSEFDAAAFNGFFDWTMTYKLDSDIPWPYGGFVKRPKARKVPDYFSEKNGEVDSQLVKDRTGTLSGSVNQSISWIVSRCKSDTKREDFVADLQRHIDVAIYGRCGPLRCSRGNASDACQHVPKHYHFYLAFENSFCPDYCTEKLYKILAIEDRPPIPIVMGGANYSQVAPPNSVIDVGDFRNPAELAVFLREVMADRELYNSFHAWRKEYRVLVWGTPAAMCGLCGKAHESLPAGTVIGPREDLDVFWDKASCQK